MKRICLRALLILPLLIFIGCAQRIGSLDQNMTELPPSAADQPLANVYQALEGSWSGEFIIYEHPLGQEFEVVIPKEPSASFLKSLHLKETNRIKVRQEYISTSPFYQKVKIVDTYTDGGTIKNVESFGVNKVEGGQLWCIVQKPNEKIVHRGTSPSKDVIIWQGEDSDPFRQEYFYETVHKDTYEIVGYGYYGADDPRKNPKVWFYGKYTRSDH